MGETANVNVSDVMSGVSRKAQRDHNERALQGFQLEDGAAYFSGRWNLEVWNDEACSFLNSLTTR